MDPKKIINKLNLKPHPEGGWYKKTFLSKIKLNNRPVSSMIYFLLQNNEHSKWHRVLDADEIWIWNLGGTLELKFKCNNSLNTVFLGNNIKYGHKMQAVIPKGAWQTAKSVESWCLVSCVVTPAFSFKGFELANKNIII